MYKVLTALKWKNVDNGNACDLIETKSPTHDYIVQQDDGVFIVRYHNRISGESDNKLDLTTIPEARSWVQDTHAEEKIQEWLLAQPQSVLARCVEWFQVAYPTPVLQNVVVQSGVHIEEVSEMFDEMEGYEELSNQLKQVAAEFKASHPAHMVNMAKLLSDEDKTDRFVDALIDQIVTATGTLTHMGVSPERLLKRVNESNFSKFVDNQAVRDTPNGKILKGPDYFEPNLKTYINLSGKPLLESIAECLNADKRENVNE